MLKNKALVWGQLLLLFPLSLVSQENAAIDFSEWYMRIHQPLGYVIHTVDGSVVQYAKFDRRSLKRGVKVPLNDVNMESMAITMVFGNCNYSYFPLSENLIFDQQQKKTSNSLNLASSGYTVDFSPLESTKIELGDWEPSRVTRRHDTKAGFSLNYSRRNYRFSSNE